MNDNCKLLQGCKDCFGTEDFYEVLNIPRTADEKQVKKAYHKLSLHVHPDRVEESVKAVATEKFKILGHIYSILSDKNKRKYYDQFGCFDFNDEEFSMRNWTDYWQAIFKPITEEDINNYEKTYKGSETEIQDLKRAYLDSKGDMDYILEMVPFTNCYEEPRLKAVIQELIDKEEVPEYKTFTEECEKKRLRRKRKWAKEAQEAQRLDAMLKDENNSQMEDANTSLSLQILNKNKAKKAQADDFLQSLMNKYAKPARTPKKKCTASKTKK